MGMNQTDRNQCSDDPESHTQFTWDEYGSSAGPLRNQEMAEYADTLVAIWDGDEESGTRNMMQEAINHRLNLHVRVVNDA